MPINIKALAATASLFWGVAVLLLALAHATWPGYGTAFLDLLASLYPGYRPATSTGSIATVTLYALVDGALGGAIFGWLYNRISCKRT